MSTFRGLEMARQALNIQQSALYTTGHNISNANTPGYTRQRVNMEAMPGYPPGSRNSPVMPGQVGSGVTAGSIQRIRNQFLDTQFRSGNASVGYWSERADALGRMENLLNEQSKSGLSGVMDEFWGALQDLGTNPTDYGAKSVVLSRGRNLAETFNYISSSMKTVRSDLKQQAEHSIDSANRMIDQLQELNDQIRKLETHGYSANDLYDKRDAILDELSGIVNIEVTYDTSHAPAGNKNADGVATVAIVDNDGNALVTLVDGVSGETKTIDQPQYIDADGFNVVEGISVDGVDILSSKGSLQGLVHAFGYAEGGEVKGDYPEMLDKLDQLAFAIVTSFNELHEENGTSVPFFEDLTEVRGAASSINVVLDDPNDLIVSTTGNEGSGDNALRLAEMFTKENSHLDGNSINEFMQSLTGDLGVSSEHALKMLENTATLQHQVNNQRLSVSAVSLDEEMTNMIKFQHAYNAAARGMTAMDELIDTIINRMGLVGR